MTQHQTILSHYKEGMKLKDIAALVGLSVPSISRIAHVHGLTRSKTVRNKDVQAVRLLMADGLSAYGIARRLGIKKRHIQHIIDNYLLPSEKLYPKHINQHGPGCQHLDL